MKYYIAMMFVLIGLLTMVVSRFVEMITIPLFIILFFVKILEIKQIPYFVADPLAISVFGTPMYSILSAITLFTISFIVVAIGLQIDEKSKNAIKNFKK